MLDQPKIMLSTLEQWAEYHRLKSIEHEKQLKSIASLLPHFVRLGIEGKAKDVHMLGRRAANILKYPRDKNPLIEALAAYPELDGGVLREDLSPQLCTRTAGHEGPCNGYPSPGCVGLGPKEEAEDSEKGGA